MWGCDKLETPPNKVPNGGGEEGEEKTGEIYKVVAHRGGYLECNRPDCSVSALKYALGLNCCASECDVVLTKDKEVLVVHPKSGYLVNGLEPFNHTAAEIRAAGKLANGETIPSLGDFLAVLQDKKMNPHGMVLQLDVKRLTKNDVEINVQHSIDVCYRACEIINELKANDLCEFLIPTGTDIFNVVRNKVLNEYKIALAWMSASAVSNYKGAFAQLSYEKMIGTDSSYTPATYIDANIPLVIYNVDTEAQIEAVMPYYPKLKAIFSNYPALVIKKLKAAGYAE